MDDSAIYRIAQRFAGLSAEQRKAVYQRVLAEGLTAGQFPVTPRAPAASRDGGQPLSYAQSRQWFLWELEGGGSAYHITGALRLQGKLDVAAVRESFGAIVARHEALRTVFRANAEGLAEQWVMEAGAFQFSEFDLADADADAAGAEAEAGRVARELAETPFELGTGPLLRIGLLRLAPEEHVLVVVMHHIVSDGWSVQLIVDEFTTQYRAWVAGEVPALAELPVQYADYAVWQRNWLEAGEKARQLAYWRAQLGDEQPVLQLATDHPRHAQGVYRSARHSFVLPASLLGALRQGAQAQGATVFMLLLAGYHALLHRYSAQEDIRVGVPVANRQRVETEGLVGLFVNSQVLRAQVSGRMTLAQLVQQVREAALGAQAHQDLPFEQLVEALQPERSLSVSPLFQTMFNYQREDLRALQQLPGLTLSDYALGERAAQFELVLDVSEDAAGQARGSLAYAAELFEADTIARMAEHYVRLLEALVARPEQAVGDVALLGDAERDRLQAWSLNPTRYANSEPVHRLVERQDPDALALIFGDQTLTYGELNARANRLAHRLIAEGVGPEVRVGIALPRSVEMVVGLLAILKAGGAYVPLDPEYPADRLAYMVEDSGIALLLTHSTVTSLPAMRALHLDTADLSAEPSHHPEVQVHADNLAYVIYTSGSTGKPKGVGISHGALARHTLAAIDLYALTAADRTLQFATLNFDAFVDQLFPPLAAGASVVVRGQDVWDTTSFHREVTGHGITVADLTTAYWMLLAQDFGKGGRDLGALRLVITGGEAMPPEGLKLWRDARLGHIRLLNAYGPTEATVTASVLECSPWLQGEAPLPAHMPIGRPVAGRALRVVDADLRPMPPGVPGELCIGGALLARGYLHRAGLTSERFVADPFDAEGGRLYRTGDLVRWRADGQLEYLGRIDHQVKIRGFRIELGEIEAQLLAQPAVREAVVVAKDGRLVAYVSGEAEPEGLRERLSAVLPDYMVPGAIVVLEALPLNPNGKVDRKALPEPGQLASAGYEAPEGEIETTLARIWADVLNLPRVGRHDNFFTLGGHSLLAIQLLERVRRHGWPVAVRTLFQHPVLQDFARAVGGEASTEVVVPPNGIPSDCTCIEPSMLTLVSLEEEAIRSIEATIPGGAANIQDIYPLAPLQQGILFHHLLQAEGDAYITTCMLAFDSRERLTRFMAHLNAVIARHDILRTAVLWEGLPEPVQVVCRTATLVPEWLPEGKDAEARLLAAVDPAHYRLDVRRAPLLGALAVHDTEAGRWLLQLPSHHLVMDHTTLELLVEEIGLIGEGRADELPTPVPFRRYVAQARLGVSEAQHEAFFRQMLGEVETPTAPYGLLDVRGDGTRVGEARLPVAPALSAKLRQLAQRHGVSAATLFHLAWALVVGRSAGQDDVVFGTVLFGRMQGGEDAQRALGLFINTLPLRVKLGPVAVAQALRDTHAGLTGLLTHEHASLALAQRCSSVPSGTPLFSALLNYRYSAPAQSQAQWEGMTTLGGDERNNYPFTMNVDDLGEDFALVAQVVQPLDPQQVCEALHGTLAALASALEKHPQQLLCELEGISGLERTQLEQWGVNAHRYDNVEPVHRMVERQDPHAVALLFGDECLTYGELNARANRLAHRLIAEGVGPDVRVGIAVPRSVEMMVGLLAILKAGGAYVPLDPEYPADRLAYMVESSGITLLLTHSTVTGLPPVRTTLELDTLELDTLDTSAHPDHAPQVPVHGETLAYVIYTSGSTGKPKGVMVRHRGLSHFLLSMQDKPGLTGDDVLLAVTSLSFDIAALELYLPLLCGARVVLAPREVVRDGRALGELMQARGVTALQSTPAGWRVLLAGGWRPNGPLKGLCGGEALQPDLAHTLKELGVELWNMYGPTETTIWSTAVPVDGEAAVGGHIGGPIGDTALRVLDAALQPVPAGVPGELYLGGVGLARGYLHRPDLAAERFVADPFDSEGGRLYRTGDLVRWRADGQLEYLGRIDHQVKIRGFRIELGEIETQLLAQPEVREAVVVAKDGRLVGYVAGEIEPATLRERLAQTLPDYMVPGAIIVLDTLPLNPNGKVDRKALPEPGEASGHLYEAPHGEAETALAQIWSEVLGAARVGRHDTFFELGGHSLAALQVQARTQARFAVQVPLRFYFEGLSLSAIAQALEAARQTQADESSELDEMSALLEALEN